MRETRFVAVSLLIAGVLGAQTIASLGLQPGPIGKDPYLWPFLRYPMYDNPYYEGDKLTRYRVYGVFPDSSEAAVTPETLGTDFWIFYRGLVFAILDQDHRELAAFAALYGRRHGRRPVVFRLEDHALVLDRSGLAEVPREVLGVVPVEAREAP